MGVHATGATPIGWAWGALGGPLGSAIGTGIGTAVDVVNADQEIAKAGFPDREIGLLGGLTGFAHNKTAPLGGWADIPSIEQQLNTALSPGVVPGYTSAIPSPVAVEALAPIGAPAGLSSTGGQSGNGPWGAT